MGNVDLYRNLEPQAYATFCVDAHRQVSIYTPTKTARFRVGIPQNASKPPSARLTVITVLPPSFSVH